MLKSKTKTMKFKTTLILLFIPFYFLAQQSKSSDYKTISGFISYQNKNLKNVSIFIKNTTRYAVSDNKGFYSIKAKVGEIISYSYIGLNSVEIAIEDVTSKLNIVMKISDQIIDIPLKKELKLGESNIGENIVMPTAIKIEGKSLNQNALSITRAIQEKIPYFIIRYDDFGEEIIYIKGRELDGPVMWEIDNTFFDVPFDIHISEVIEVLIFNYMAVKSIIKVKTSINYKKLKGINFDNYFFTDDEYYNFDAIPFKKITTKHPSLDKYKRIANIKEAQSIYSNTYNEDENSSGFHIALFNHLKKEKNSKPLLINILTDYEKIIEKNPEDLKVIAYKYQEINEPKKALEIFKLIAKLRPKHLQTYRDIANTYLDLKMYKEFWLAYNKFLKNNENLEDNDIGEIMSSEIISSYNLDTINRPNIRKISINNPTKNIESDVRLVFEWNTTEAEFILEFVNPSLEIYKLENSLRHHNELILDQKTKGYTSKEMFIEDLRKGNYYVNFTYLGNKQYKPTTLKITTYYNWGRKNQSKKIDVFDFTQKDKKVQLLKLNRRFLR